jgi:hypothetical protein
MAQRVGTWWIKDGRDERRKEAQGFGDVLANLSSFSWTQDHGDSAVVKNDFVETAGHAEKVDEVDLMYMSSHGSYNPDDASTWGHAFSVSDGTVRTSDAIDWGKNDLEIFSSHACKLLYHSTSNSVGRWIAAFKRLHYMFGFHTVSNSGKDQEERGEKFAAYAAWHLFFPSGFMFGPDSYTLRAAWKKACCETEGSSVKWAYLRANGRPYAGGPWVNTYNERLEASEPNDPVVEREFWTAKGSC